MSGKQLEIFGRYVLKHDSPDGDMGLKDNSLIFIACDSDSMKIIGLATVLIVDEHDLYGFFSKFSQLNLNMHSLVLYNVCVDPNSRGKGIAKHLLTEVDNWAKSQKKTKIILFVKMKNEPALNLYKKFGYTIDTTTSSVVQKNDEHLMSKLLK